MSNALITDREHAIWLSGFIVGAIGGLAATVLLVLLARLT